MTAAARRFREAAAARTGLRYPEALRAAARQYAEAAIGRSRGEIASELGVGVATLSRWLSKRGDAERGLHEVVLRPSPEQRLTIVSPSGWRVEGLSFEEVAELLRVLG